MIKTQSNKEYHSDNAISKTKLFQISKTPAYYKWYCENPQEPTADLIFGSAFHKYVLEQDDFYNEFAIAPNFDKRTKDGKQQALDFATENDGKTIISEQDFATIKAMRESVMANEYAKKLLSKGGAETSIYWTDELTQIDCKCRPDYLRTLADTKVIIDLKSCRSADDYSIMKDSIKYGYDLQSGMYREGVAKEFGISKEKVSFLFIFVEKCEPFLINVKQADEFFLQRGENLMREFLGVLKDCQTTGNYYGYNGFSNEPSELNLPSYLVKENE